VSDTPLSRSIASRCSAFRRRLRFALLAVGLGRLFALLTVAFALLLIIDWRLHLPTSARVVTLGLVVTTAGLLGWFSIIRPLRERWSDQAVLARLDSAGGGQHLELYELLHQSAGIQELKSEQGKAFAAAALERDPSTDANAFRAAIDGRPARRWLMRASLCVLVIGVVGVLLPNYLAIGAERFANPFSRTRWPHRTTIAVQPPANGWAVPQLEAIAINATVTGEVPKKVQLAYRIGTGDTWTKENIVVKEAEGGFAISHTFPEVREPIEFTLEGGDYLTDPQTIQVIQRPFIKSIAAYYEYPSYAGLPNKATANGQLAGLEGTQVRLELEASMPLDKAVFIFTPEVAGISDVVSVIDQRSPTRFEKTLMLERSGRYRIELYESNGFREARPEVYDVRVTPDDPPEIEMLAPGRDLAETRNASLDVAFRAQDKLGLAGIEFMIQIDDQPPQPLTDRITGPLPQTGTDNTVRFNWDLRKMDLPDAGNLRYFVRVRDNNPTGRGNVVSPPGLIKLIKPSDFHLETLEQTKQLEEEARIAWRNQLLAWKRGSQFLQTGTGAEGDPAWSEMLDAQQKAFAAAKQIQFHFRNLTAKYERNHMSDDFMAGRLSVIAQLLTRLLEQEHAPLAVYLAGARPRSAADAAPERLKTLRTAALSAGKDHQKLATLLLEQMLRRLYDWRDLQTCTVSTRLLYEQQEEVLGRTQVIAPKTIAKEIEDLKDGDQEKVLTLGKQQRAIFDTETGLETQLTYLMYKAEKQGRKTILDPLQAAFGNLRTNRVNFHLKRAAELIENNQPAQIIDNQKAALRALQVAQAGLVLAGQKVDPEQPITLAQNPIDESQFDPDQIKVEVAKKDTGNVDEPKSMDPVEPISEIPTLPEGADPLSAAVRLCIELQDNVLARMRYLQENRGEGEMPRFIKLKQSRLLERQDAALKALTAAIQEADKAKDVAAKSILDDVATSMKQARQLLDANDTSAGPQQLDVDFIEQLKGLMQHLALRKTVEDAVAENRRQNGVDGFGRKYLLRGNDLETTVTLLAELDQARQALSGAVRAIDRFQKHADGKAPWPEIEKANRERAVAAIQRVAASVTSLPAKQAVFSKGAQARLHDSVLTTLAGQSPAMLVAVIQQSGRDAEVGGQLRLTQRSLAEGVQLLRDLLEERVKEEPKVAVKEPPRLTLEQAEKLQSREHLAEMLKNEASLPPEVRERIVKALEKEFPAKYRDLLQAYYGSLITPMKKE